jgi:hypothetical protein
MVKPEVDDSNLSALEGMTKGMARGIARRSEFLLKEAHMIESAEQYLDVVNNKQRKLILRYLRSPSLIESDFEGNLKGVALQRNVLEGEKCVPFRI